jgi:ribokinase
LKKIIVLGSINTDFVIRTIRHPKSGETVSGSDYATYFGGKGANQAIAAARLGAHVSMIGRIGEDSFGKAAFENLKKEKVNTKFITIDPTSPSGAAFVVIDESGNNTIVVSPGANGHVNLHDLDQAKSCFSHETVLVTQFEVPISTVIAGIELAKARGSYVIVNPTPVVDFDFDLFKKIDAMILNESELYTLTKCGNLHQGLKTLQDGGVKRIALTLGEKGCILMGENKEFNIQPHSIKVVDTTGAGDAFVGAFSAAVAEDNDFLTAGLWGNAAGAIAVTSFGAQSSLPNRDQIFDLFNRSKVES